MQDKYWPVALPVLLYIVDRVRENMIYMFFFCGKTRKQVPQPKLKKLYDKIQSPRVAHADCGMIRIFRGGFVVIMYRLRYNGADRKRGGVGPCAKNLMSGFPGIRI